MVACDGGGVSVEKVPGADALYVHLQTPAEGIALNAVCEEEKGDENGAFRLNPGVDDKLFRLQHVPVSQCDSTEHTTRSRAGSQLQR